MNGVNMNPPFPCSGCGERGCDGRCYLESPSDYATDEVLCIGCDKSFDAHGWCAACEESREEQLRLTEVRSDPFLNRRAA